MKLLSRQQPINYTLANRSGGDGAIDISDGFSDLEKFYMISNSSVCNDISDMVQYTGAGPMSIAVGDTVLVSIVLFAAESYSGMLEAVDSAISKYTYLHGGSGYEGVDYLQAMPLVLYPNPVSDWLEVSGLERDYEIEVVDEQGRLVYSGRNVTSLDVSDYPAGTYSVSVTSVEGTKRAKFVKVK